MNEETIQLSKGAEQQILGAYLKLAAQLEWQASEHGITDHEYWHGTAVQFDATEHARQLYNEGRYQQAIDALPAF